MTDKKQIIFLAALAALSFVVSFLASSLFGRGAEVEPAAAPPPQEPGLQPQERVVPVAAPGEVQKVTISMREQELDRLVKELRLKLKACKDRAKQLDERQKRIELAAQLLEKQAKELEALQVQLVAPLARLREAQVALEHTRVRVGKLERANLKHTASIYEKMDAASGSRILVGMCENKQEDDVVKILFYMSKRAAAKLLAEIPDKNMAAGLCQKLKKVQEEG